MPPYRTERDSLGEIQVPAAAYYGAQTARALQNFPISDLRLPRRFVWALGLVKRAAARANEALGTLDAARAGAIAAAAQEVMDGHLDEHFVVDVFQTGSGTSTNMNANEVVSNRAIEALGGVVGSKDPVHPNDHVNLGQSSNDVIPTATHVAAAVAIERELGPALAALRTALEDHARATDEVVKSGRTHLMDATPIRLGQEIGGWAAQVAQGERRARAARDALLELALGGTAVGTGVNRHPHLPREAIARIVAETGLPFVEAPDHFEAQGARDGVVEASGLLRTVAGSLAKIANDVRWLASGPRTGLAELRLPALAPGSSIMPGKVNPVMSEALVMACHQVMANDLAITLSAGNGAFQLNTGMPLMAHALLQSIDLLARGVDAFTTRCVLGMQADAARCAATVERNLALGTALVPRIGYDRAAALAKAALKHDRSIREEARASQVLSDDELTALLDPRAMTEP